jgi:SPP1 gp7 family putative phage head morphogenesis protein
MRVEIGQWLSVVERRIARQNGRLDKELAIVYRQAAREVNAAMGVVFEKYSVDGILTPAELERYGRMNAIEDELNRISGATTQRARAMIEAHQELVFKSALAQYRWAVDKGFGRTFPWGRIDQAAVQRAIASPLEKISMERLKTNSRERIRGVLAQGLVRGDGYARMAREMRGAINGSAYDAVRIARTEAHRVQNEAHLERTKEVEAMGGRVVKVWSSAEDARTRDQHREMEGVEADKNGIFTLPDGARGEAPGLTGEAHHDINCRCTYLEIIEIPD